jgi:hypothetical protein
MTKTRGVVYMLTGSKHGPMLAVGILALRQLYDGPVCLIAGNAAAQEICDKIAADSRSGYTTVERWEAPVGGGKGLQHGNKTRITELMPFDEAVFLDCDTLVVGDFAALWPRAGTEEVVLTQFANWSSNDRKIKGRTEPWREILPAEVARSQGNRYPAINTGTFGITKLSGPYVKRWQTACAKRPSFMCDELVAQVIFPDFPHRVLDERWNCSPIFSHERYGPPKDADVRIWHGHGWKFISRPHGNRIWMPYFNAAARQGFAQLNGWALEADKRLRKVIENGGPQRRA